MTEEAVTIKKKKKAKKGGKIELNEWDSMKKEMSEADDGTLKVIDLTDPTKNEDENLKTDYSFSVFYKSPKEHKMYKGALLFGTFSGHIATFEDHIRMGQVRSSCRGGLAADSFDEDFNLMVEQKAVFEVLLDDFPDWFDLEKLYDRMVAIQVYQEVLQREAGFRGGVL